jgi:integrase/recombinase XerD
MPARFQLVIDCKDPELRDVQEAASHADPRTTMRYDRARTSLDRHATYIVAAYVSGAAR